MLTVTPTTLARALGRYGSLRLVVGTCTWHRVRLVSTVHGLDCRYYEGLTRPCRWLWRSCFADPDEVRRTPTRLFTAMLAHDRRWALRIVAVYHAKTLLWEGP